MCRLKDICWSKVSFKGLVVLGTEVLAFIETIW